MDECSSFLVREMEMESVVDLLDAKEGNEAGERSLSGVELKVGSSMGRSGRSAAESLLVCLGEESYGGEEVMESGVEVMGVGRRKKEEG